MTRKQLSRVLDVILALLGVAIVLLTLSNCAARPPSPAQRAAQDCAEMSLTSAAAYDSCKIALAQQYVAKRQTCRTVPTAFGWKQQCE